MDELCKTAGICPEGSEDPGQSGVPAASQLGTKGVAALWVDDRCPVCGSQDLVWSGPLTLEGNQAVVRDLEGRQCILCGTLQVMIPQAVLVRWYPPNVSYLTQGWRQRHRQRRKSKRLPRSQ